MTFDLDQYLQGHLAMILQGNCKNMAHLVISALQHVQFLIDSFPPWLKWSLPWEGVSHAMTFDLELFLPGHLAAKICHILSCLLYNTYSSNWILSIFLYPTHNKVVGGFLSISPSIHPSPMPCPFYGSFWLGMKCKSIVWVIMGRQEVSSERRLSDWSS